MLFNGIKLILMKTDCQLISPLYINIWLSGDSLTELVNYCWLLSILLAQNFDMVILSYSLLCMRFMRIMLWFPQGAPQPILESHELSTICLEYRRECGRDSVLQSLTAVSSADTDAGSFAHSRNIECKHLLKLEDGAEIVRGRTEWRPKYVKNSGALNEAPAAAYA